MDVQNRRIFQVIKAISYYRVHNDIKGLKIILGKLSSIYDNNDVLSDYTADLISIIDLAELVIAILMIPLNTIRENVLRKILTNKYLHAVIISNGRKIKYCGNFSEIFYLLLSEQEHLMNAIQYHVHVNLINVLSEFTLPEIVYEHGISIVQYDDEDVDNETIKERPYDYYYYKLLKTFIDHLQFYFKEDVKMIALGILYNRKIQMKMRIIFPYAQYWIIKYLNPSFSKIEPSKIINIYNPTDSKYSIFYSVIDRIYDAMEHFFKTQKYKYIWLILCEIETLLDFEAIPEWKRFAWIIYFTPFSLKEKSRFLKKILGNIFITRFQDFERMDIDGKHQQSQLLYDLIRNRDLGKQFDQVKQITISNDFEIKLITYLDSRQYEIPEMTIIPKNNFYYDIGIILIEIIGHKKSNQVLKLMIKENPESKIKDFEKYLSQFSAVDIMSLLVLLSDDFVKLKI